MKMRVLIVDDEEMGRRGVRARLKGLADVEIVGECRNGEQAIAAMRKHSPDVVFLDIQMPQMSGFDVLAELPPSQLPYVIFVTAFDQYALRAFAVHALDYLLKPIDDERFTDALERARTALARDRGAQAGKNLSELLKTVERESRPDAERIVVRSAGRVAFVQVADIEWVEAAGDYVTLHTAGRSWLMRETMAVMEERLVTHGFLRIHRSAVVNVSRVRELKAIDNGDYFVFLERGDRLRLSRTYKPALEKMLQRC